MAGIQVCARISDGCFNILLFVECRTLSMTISKRAELGKTACVT